MGLFITSLTAANRHGVYAIERTPPRMVNAKGTGVVALLGQFPWGPAQQVITPVSGKALQQMFCPDGMDRTSGAYLSIIAKAFPELRLVRILPATGSAKAVATLMAALVETITLTAKYDGASGNSLVATVSDATDGDVNHFNLSVSVTGASGTTTDTLTNLNYSATGTHSAPDLSSKLLLGSITSIVNGRPTNGTYNFVSGADGTITAADYVGSAGTGNRGVALLEGQDVNHVCVDDCGTALRAAVNAGLLAHATLMGDRVAYVNGDSGQTSAQVLSSITSYRTATSVYVPNWVYVYDDTTGAERLVPPAPFAASVAAQLSPSTSIAWKDPEVGAVLQGIVRLETDYGAAIGQLTDAGACTLINERGGGFRFEAGVVTVAPQDSGRKNLTRTRMGQYIAKGIVDALRPFVDAPNVELNRTAEVAIVDGFLGQLKANQFLDPNHTPHVVDYSIGSIAASNSEQDTANGLFIIPLNVKTSAGQEKIILSFQFGEGVKITAS